jgi:hypothetical protein
MPQGWVVGSFVFLTPVRHRGGAFVVYPGSPARIRTAAARHGPGCLKDLPGAAPGPPFEVLAEPGDAVLFHHLMAHSGSTNVADPRTRHALLNRYHPTTRLCPGERPLADMSTLEKANSARYLLRARGVGRCLHPAAGPAALRLDLGLSAAAYTVVHSAGAFQLLYEPAAAPGTLRRLCSADLCSWAEAPPLALPGLAAGPLRSAAAFHYDLAPVLALVDAAGAAHLFAGAEEVACGRVVALH